MKQESFYAFFLKLLCHLVLFKTVEIELIVVIDIVNPTSQAMVPFNSVPIQML